MITNPVTISSKMLMIQMSITIITCFMYKDIINASCNKGMPNHNVETLDKVSPIDISEQLSLQKYIYEYQNTYKNGGFSYDLKYTLGHTKIKINRVRIWQDIHRESLYRKPIGSQ